MNEFDSRDVERLTGMSPPAWGEKMRRDALTCLAQGDWHGAYEDAKSWISIGGGAWILDPWLIYVASALLHGQPRQAVHSVDIPLQSWIADPMDRAILHWVRAAIIHRRLRDPKTARADYDRASATAPPWLHGTVLADLDACAQDAERSRKRKASVGPAPEYRGAYAHDIVAPPQENRPPPGSVPAVWDAVLPYLQAPS
jgi:hypothetical protein